MVDVYKEKIPGAETWKAPSGTEEKKVPEVFIPPVRASDVTKKQLAEIKAKSDEAASLAEVVAPKEIAPKANYTEKSGWWKRTVRWMAGAGAAMTLGTATQSEAAPLSTAAQAMLKSRSPSEKAKRVSEFNKFVTQKVEPQAVAPVHKENALNEKATLSPAMKALLKQRAKSAEVKKGLGLTATKVEPRVDNKATHAKSTGKINKPRLEIGDINLSPKPKVHAKNRTQRKNEKMAKKNALELPEVGEWWKSDLDAVHAIKTLGLNLDTVKVEENCTESSLGERCELSLYDGKKIIRSVGVNPSNRSAARKVAWRRLTDPNDSGVEFSESSVAPQNLEIHAADSQTARFLSDHKEEIEHAVATLGFTTPTKIQIHASEGSLGEKVEITLLNGSEKIVVKGVHPSDRAKAFRSAIKKLESRKV